MYKIIDETNFNYLVRKEINEYSVSLCYAVPRKTKKGYLGMKHESESLNFKDKEKALRLYANWKEDYVPKFHKQELLYVRINYSPITHYYTICPKCGQEAEILTWMVMMGTGMEECHHIICEHCAPNPKNRMDALHNRVGECRVNLFGCNEETKTILLKFHNAGIKWDDWINGKNE